MSLKAKKDSNLQEIVNVNNHSPIKLPNKQDINFHSFFYHSWSIPRNCLFNASTWKTFDAQNYFLKMAPLLLSSSLLLVTEKDSNSLSLVSKPLSISRLWFRITISPFYFWPLFYVFSYWVYGGIAFASWVLGIIDYG